MEALENQENKTTEAEMVDVVDASTGNTVQIPKEYQQLFNSNMSMNYAKGKKETKTKYDPVVNEAEKLRGENGELSTALDDLQTANMNAKDKADHEHRKELSAMQKKLDASAEWKTRFKDNRKQNDIMNALSAYNLNNARQTMASIMTEGKVEVQEIDGNFITEITMNLPDENGILKEMKLTPAEAVKLWLDQPGNLYHLINSLNPGGGSQGTANGKKLNEKEKLIESYNEAEKNKDGVKMLELRNAIQKLPA